MPAKVTTGMSAFLSAWTHTTRRSATPLSRASFTYSESSTSSMPERNSRIIPATTNQPSVNPGSTYAARLSAPPAGSHCNRPATNSTSTMATQNVGSDWPSTATSCAARSMRSEEHTSELQSQSNLVCRLLLEKKKKKINVFRIYIKKKKKKKK